jgi:hypothetical protein
MSVHKDVECQGQAVLRLFPKVGEIQSPPGQHSTPLGAQCPWTALLPWVTRGNGSEQRTKLSSVLANNAGRLAKLGPGSSLSEDSQQGSAAPCHMGTVPGPACPSQTQPSPAV